jgi:NAD(P)-dependent dehydrogenase (short-subunit alcohol dehydrogenase family)
MTNGDLFQGAIALITGANKGIGYEIARGLGARKIVVLIGARDDSRGQAAAAKLKGAWESRLRAAIASSAFGKHSAVLHE